MPSILETPQVIDAQATGEPFTTVAIPVRLLTRLRSQATEAQYAQAHLRLIEAALTPAISDYLTVVLAAKEALGIDGHDQRVRLDLDRGVFVLPESAAAHEPHQ